MPSSILWSTLPWLGWLITGIIGLAITLWLARPDFRAAAMGTRLRSIHSCETGAVQSLSLVLTLPMFLLFLLFIVQVSQLMIGTMVVHYAAYAAARAAVVWIPSTTSDLEPANVLAIQFGEVTPGHTFGTGPVTYQSPVVAVGGSSKCQQIFSAAVVACAPICPSRNLWEGDRALQLVNSYPATSRALPLLMRAFPIDANSNRFGAIQRRMQNKLAYSLLNTGVSIEWREVPTASPDAITGPTYNPRGHRDGYVITPTGPVVVQPAHVFNPWEVGWEDTVTVWVAHRYALLPGPGRFLAKFINRADGGDDATSRRIRLTPMNAREEVYTTELVASASMTIEGMKSVIERPIYAPN
jgi:hypothetical protein